MLTLGLAKTKLARYSAEDTLTDRINEAVEMLLTATNFKGSLEKVAFSVTEGVFTLPRQYFGCLGITANEFPRQIYNHWYEFVLGGPGVTDTPCSEVIDLGDGWCTAKDISAIEEDGSVVTVVSELAEDAGLKILLRGTDADSDTVYTTEGDQRIEGEYVDLAVSPGTASATTFLTLKSVVKPITNGRVYLYVGSTLIATYEPTEERPSYRRYRVPNYTDGTDITALCQRRYVEVTEDNDPLPIDNLRALGDAMLSLQYRDRNDLERSNEFLSSALSLLSKEARRFHPQSTFPPPISFPGTRAIHNIY